MMPAQAPQRPYAERVDGAHVQPWSARHRRHQLAGDRCGRLSATGHAGLVLAQRAPSIGAHDLDAHVVLAEGGSKTPSTRRRPTAAVERPSPHSGPRRFEAIHPPAFAPPVANWLQRPSMFGAPAAEFRARRR